MAQSLPVKSKGMLGMALAGLVAGAVAGVLLAPKSGAETREDIKRVAERMRGDIVGRLDKLSRVTRSAYDEVVNTVVREYQDTKEVTGEQAAKIKDELAKSYDRVKSEVAENDEETDMDNASPTG